MVDGSSAPIFLDTTVLSNFASSDSIDFLVGLLESPAVVPAVRDEIEEGLAAGHSYLQPASERLGDELPIRRGSPDAEGDELRERLDAGEAATIHAAIVHDGAVATDDLAARRVAEERGLTMTGSVGLLVRGVEHGHVDRPTADAWLETWRTQRGYYAPIDSIHEILGQEEG